MIPKADKQAIKEAQSKFMSNKDTNTVSSKELANKLHKYGEEFRQKQPELFQLIEEIIYFHVTYTDGICSVYFLALMMMAAVDSIYIQEEIDEVENIFKFDPKKFEDNFKNKLDEETDEDDDEPENPEDYLW